jgi:DNA-binding GntR family transcriptional regulator
MPKFSFIDNPYLGTKKDSVVETIRRAILVGDILPGDRITEKEVKDLLNVSSSPVREAFHQLEAEGLLVRTPHVGTKVNDMDIGDPKELYLIQSLLQGIAVRISTKKLAQKDILEVEGLNREMGKICRRKVDVKGLRVLNYKLHMILCGLNIHPWFTRVISALWIRFPTQTLWLIPNWPRTVIREHEKIIEAVKKRDEILAESSMKEHLESSLKALYGSSNRL